MSNSLTFINKIDSGKFFSQKIKELKVTRKELSSRLNISPSGVTRILNTENITINHFIEVCNALGINPIEIFKNSGEEGKVSIGNVKQHNYSGSNNVNISSASLDLLVNQLAEKDKLISEKDNMIAEKERFIQHLLSVKSI